MSLTKALNLGVQGMRASNRGATLSSNNATNVATEGYSRRSQVQLPRSMHLGVEVGANQRRVDSYVERRLNNSRSDEQEAQARLESLVVLDQVLSNEAGSVGEMLDSFEAAVTSLANDPSDPAVRQALLVQTDQLAERFNTAAESLNLARSDVNDRVRHEVSEVNDTIAEVEALTQEIGRLEHAGQDAGDLRDRRDNLVRNLADVVPVRVLEKENSYTVLMGNSIQLVSSDGGAYPLGARVDPTTGDVVVTRVMAGKEEDVTARINSGRIGGLLAARQGPLDSAQTELDQLAHDVATSYNAVHQVGFGLDGNTGRDLFEAPAAVAGYAGLITISSDVEDQPEALAAALDPTMLPGDNRNGLALQTLATSQIALGGTATASTSVGSLQGFAGGAIQDAEFDQNFAQSILHQVESLRDSVSGVSLDEEMVAMMEYQRSFEASLRVIKTADEMLNQLLSLAGR